MFRRKFLSSLVSVTATAAVPTVLARPARACETCFDPAAPINSTSETTSRKGKRVRGLTRLQIDLLVFLSVAAWTRHNLIPRMVNLFVALFTAVARYTRALILYAGINQFIILWLGRGVVLKPSLSREFSTALRQINTAERRLLEQARRKHNWEQQIKAFKASLKKSENDWKSWQRAFNEVSRKARSKTRNVKIPDNRTRAEIDRRAKARKQKLDKLKKKLDVALKDASDLKYEFSRLQDRLRRNQRNLRDYKNERRQLLKALRDPSQNQTGGQRNVLSEWVNVYMTHVKSAQIEHKQLTQKLAESKTRLDRAYKRVRDLKWEITFANRAPQGL